MQKIRTYVCKLDRYIGNKTVDIICNRKYNTFRFYQVKLLLNIQILIQKSPLYVR